jgi:excisionase family DNA binding protein
VRQSHIPDEVEPSLPLPLLTIRHVIAYTGVSEKTIRRAIRGGRLRAFKLPGGLRFRVEDVDAWLELNLVQPDPPEQDGARRTLSEVLA